MDREELKRRIRESFEEGFTEKEIVKAMKEDGYRKETVDELIAEIEQNQFEENSVRREEGISERQNDSGKNQQEQRDNTSQPADVSIGAGAKGGIMAGLVSGLIYGLIIGLISIVAGSIIGGSFGGMLAGMGIIFAVVASIAGTIAFGIWGLIIGLIFGLIFDYIPGETAKAKGIVFGSVMGVISSALILVNGGLEALSLISSFLNILVYGGWGYLLARFST